MGRHISIAFGPTLYFLPTNHNRNFIRLSELARTQLEGAMGRNISIVFGPTEFHVEKTYVL